MSRWSRRRRTRFSTKPLRQSRRLSRDLYTFFRSSTSYRLRIALAYKRLEYTPHYVSLPKMEHRTLSYRALHAQGLVPLLIDGDRSYARRQGPSTSRERVPAPSSFSPWPSSSIWTTFILNRR